MSDEDTPRITRCGREIKLDGRRIADTATEDDARALVLCIDNARFNPQEMEEGDDKFVLDYFA